MMFKKPTKYLRQSNYIIKRRLFSGIAVFLIIAFISFPFTVNADSTDGLPYNSYTYWEGYNVKRAVHTKAMYVPETVLYVGSYSDGAMSDMLHLCTDPKEKYLYLMDNGNECIRVISLEDYSTSKVISSINYNGEDIAVGKARGLYVNNEGMIYIADAERHQVLVVDEKLKVVRIITKPESDLIPEGFSFIPIRMIEDNKGYLYILSEGCYYGAMVFDPVGEFQGFFGANLVKGSILTAIGDLVSSIFETDEKRESSLQKLPSDFADISISPDGFLFTVSSSVSGQVRKLGLDGTNNLKYSSGYLYSNADGYNFSDIHWEFFRNGKGYRQSFSGICVDPEGFFYIIDSIKGRVYMYDQECRLLCVFGGGMGEGSQTGMFSTACALTYANNRLFVLDRVNQTVTVFVSTSYGEAVRKADKHTIKGDYLEAVPYWNQVLEQDKNSQVAYKGLAKAAVLSENYTVAMDYARRGLDQATYAQAFETVSNQFVQRNFLWIFTIVILVLGLILYMAVITSKRKIVLIKNQSMRTCLRVINHPFESFNGIKYHGRGSLIISLVLLLLLYITQVLSDTAAGFMYVIDGITDFNALYVLLGTVGLILLWVAVNWGVCVLMEGKGSLKEILYVSCYSLLPMILYKILFTVISHFVIPTDGFLQVLLVIAVIYSSTLMLVGMSIIHEFSFFWSLGTAVLTIIGMVLTTFVLFVVLMLGQDLIGFIISIVREAMLR